MQLCATCLLQAFKPLLIEELRAALQQVYCSRLKQISCKESISDSIYLATVSP
jgi:hypothetical protein